MYVYRVLQHIKSKGYKNNVVLEICVNENSQLGVHVQGPWREGHILQCLTAGDANGAQEISWRLDICCIIKPLC